MVNNVLEKYLQVLVARKSDSSIYDPNGLNICPIDKAISLAKYFSAIEGTWGTLVESVTPGYAIYGVDKQDGMVSFAVIYLGGIEVPHIQHLILDREGRINKITSYWNKKPVEDAAKIDNRLKPLVTEGGTIKL